jgi:hypothetical protein
MTQVFRGRRLPLAVAKCRNRKIAKDVLMYMLRNMLDRRLFIFLLGREGWVRLTFEIKNYYKRVTISFLTILNDGFVVS